MKPPARAATALFSVPECPRCCATWLAHAIANRSALAPTNNDEMPHRNPRATGLLARQPAMLRRVGPPHPSQLCRAVRFAPLRHARRGRGALQLTAAQRPAAGGGDANGERPALQAYLLELQLLGEPTREAVQALLKEQRQLETIEPPPEEGGASGGSSSPLHARQRAQLQDLEDSLAALFQAFLDDPRVAADAINAFAKLVDAMLKFAPPSPSQQPADQQGDLRAAKRREAALHKQLVAAQKAKAAAVREELAGLKAAAAAREELAAVREDLAASKATLAAQDQAAAVQRKAAAAAARREAAARKELAAAKATVVELEARPA